MKRKRLSPGRLIALGFASFILVGTLLLLLPAAHNPGVSVSWIDALFTATSAVCVTGLSVVETASTFSVLGRIIIIILIQVGGLGFASIGVGFFVLSGRKINLRERTLLREALNYPDLKGILKLAKSVLIITVCFELVGTLLSMISFSRDFPFWQALGISAFHAVSAFNNAGFDILGTGDSLAAYRQDPMLNLVTCGLIIAGGIGFFVIIDLLQKRSFRRLSLHSKAALTATGVLLLVGTVLIKAAEGKNMTWLGAFFNSVTARTAGFATYPMSVLSNGGLFVMMLLMFIGASPGSTGGGVKTTTIYVLLRTLIASSTNQEASGFKRKFPRELVHKAFVIITLALSVVVLVTFSLCMLEPEMDFLSLFFESVSAFGTVGLSIGITPQLGWISKLVIVLTMYIGRLGPLTIATLWIYRPDAKISRPEESLSVG